MPDLKIFLSQIKSDDSAVRYAAWRSAGPMGAEAIKPLADLMKEDDRKVGKAAKEAAQQIVHHAARPGAQDEARAVADALVKVAASPRPRMVRSNALYWLGLVGDDAVVPALVKLLGDREIREDARMALERLPSDDALRALRDAAKTVSPDFRPNIEQSLRNRAMTAATTGVA